MSSRRVSSSLILHLRVRKEEEEGGGGFKLLGEGQLNKQREQRRGGTGGGEGLTFSLSVPRNLSKPIYLGPLALRALWVLSFGDR